MVEFWRQSLYVTKDFQHSISAEPKGEFLQGNKTGQTPNLSSPVGEGGSGYPQTFA
jgi:hypothetical protein